MGVPYITFVAKPGVDLAACSLPPPFIEEAEENDKRSCLAFNVRCRPRPATIHQGETRQNVARVSSDWCARKE